MILSSAMPHQIEIPVQDATQPQARDEFRIEEILRRARRIHREHGGFFGYDFDDWAQAWAETTSNGRSRRSAKGRRKRSSICARTGERGS